MEHRLVTASEAAKNLGIPVSSLYRMAANHVIPSYPIGPKLRGRRFDVQEIRSTLRELSKKRTSTQVHG